MHLNQLHFPCLSSTNTWAKEHIEYLPKDELTVISAAQQTNGYGRFQHKWLSPPNQNLYLTYVFFLDKHRDDLGNITQILAISAVDLLKVLSFPAKIKWPNDLLLHQKKMGGILCETCRIGHYLAIIAGIGINVNMTEEELKTIARPATSLYAEKGELVDRQWLLEAFNSLFKANLEIFLDKGFASFYEIFLASLNHKKGDKIQFHDHNRVCRGVFERINPDGSLQLLHEDGTSKKYYSGEILL
ncbi:putative biotin-[acetyl-CoA-carboxylase] ligase/biotin repressor (Bifunctional) [Chlamydiales bacterium STE3]|nr:putative biotin-[acetyl-CoA-carboxylase] ligase/biotin repressor (Bifunctional) [Chlamydiales bacterium STE3]